MLTITPIASKMPLLFIGIPSFLLRAIRRFSVTWGSSFADRIKVRSIFDCVKTNDIMTKYSLDSRVIMEALHQAGFLVDNTLEAWC